MVHPIGSEMPSSVGQPVGIPLVYSILFFEVDPKARTITTVCVFTGLVAKRDASGSF